MSKITITHQDGIAKVLLDGQDIGDCVANLSLEINPDCLPTVRLNLCPLAADLDLGDAAVQLSPLRTIGDDPIPEAMERQLLAHLLKKYPFARSDHWARNGAPLHVGVDMATGPDKHVEALMARDPAAGAAGGWTTVGHIHTNVAGDSRYIPLQRLKVKDTMKAEPNRNGVVLAYETNPEMATLTGGSWETGPHFTSGTDGRAGNSSIFSGGGGGAAPGAHTQGATGGNGTVSDEHRSALSLVGNTGPELTAPQAPWPFGSAKPITLLPEEADEPGHPTIPTEPHVAANLFKVR
jgi:hypothetical protein